MKNNKTILLVAALALAGFTQNISAGVHSAIKKVSIKTEKNLALNPEPATASSKPTSGNSSDAGYSTGIGLRGGWTSGLSVKHFIKSNAALEGILGSRWHGISFTGLYEINKANALDVPGLSWEYGGGIRIGAYSGKYYPNYEDGHYYDDRNYTAFSLVGIFGLEYHFHEIPFTLGFDLMPYIDIVGRSGSYLDGSLSFRYAF